ncbi:efflux RND transporter periplasmic adaptor subunit [Aureliella helgolandensis]|uniref:Multidrug resistance protein MdtN n=1 Tax=Aureliella helgolandensis TaxID=2527968 RepID=A0A518G603_9BACT|nr:HlyD family secretion protein [Aureliella helgolandensis]QDV24022.1 Multidrug resistance protein MdtN [Aureliella helgolandensis]
MYKNLLFGLVIPAVLLSVGLGVFFGLQRPLPPKKPPLGESTSELLAVLPIAEVSRVRALEEMSDSLDIPVSGTVVPFRELQIASEVSGRIIEKDSLVRSGNYVTQGQVLYRIDPRDYEIDIERLTQRREQELAAIKELQQDIENATRMLEVSNEEFKLAEDEVKRFEALGGNFTSAAEFDAARRSRLASMNQQVSAQNQLQTLRTRQGRLELATRLAETELHQAELNLERTVIRAPVSGRIVTEEVEAGSFVQRGTMLVTIEDTERVEVACNLRMDQLFWIVDRRTLSTEALVNPAQLSRFQLPNTPVKVRFRTGGREHRVYEWEGTLDRYDGAGLDAQSRTVPIRVMVPHPEKFSLVGEVDPEKVVVGPPMLVRGMFVEVIVQAKPATSLILVPKLSIKPASRAYEIWKFEADDEAIHFSREYLRAQELAKKNAELAGKMQSKPAAAPPKPAASSAANQRTIEVHPEEWQAGFLRVIPDVQVIDTFSEADQTTASEGEYWICEAPVGLEPGDLVVVTPLPGMEGSGRDPVRVEKAGLAAAVSAGKDSQ